MILGTVFKTSTRSVKEDTFEDLANGNSSKVLAYFGEFKRNYLVKLTKEAIL